MPNEKDEYFWGHVEVTDETKDRWKCKYCEKEFSGRATRIKAHLGKVPRKGIGPCKSLTLPEEVSLKARAALTEKDPTDKDSEDIAGGRGKSPSSSHKRRRVQSNTGSPPMDSYVEGQPQGPNPPGGSATQLEIGGTSSASVQHITNLTGSSSNPIGVIGESRSNSSVIEHKMETLERKLRRIAHRSARKREELDRDIYQTEERLKKLKAIKNEFGTTGRGGNDSSQLETQVDGLSSAADELLIRRGIHSESLLPKGQGPEGGTFLLTDPVGKDFKKHMDNILNYLLGGDISRIGIYGMGGIGKTYPAKHLYNKLLDDESFEKVFWVSVSIDATICDLQSKIARAVKAVNIFTKKKEDEEEEDEEEKRAGLLHEHLRELGKSVLILDDVWEEFGVKEVGIPIQGLKLVLTTRSLNICRKICEEQIKIECLPEEALSLLMKHLGCEYDSLPWRAENMVEDILDQCGGLPLAIVETAKVIRGRVPEHNGPPDLTKLGGVSLDEMYKRIFPILKTSFHRLTFQMQQCFLRCALYEEEVGRSGLIELFIDERLISPTSRAMMLKEGYVILDGLIDACLLERSYPFEEDLVEMHSVIGKMARNIMGTKCMLGTQDFWNMRDEKYWSMDLQLESIRYNPWQRDIPVGFSPKCPKLSTLLLSWHSASKIPDSLFKHLVGLKVLNLSNSWIEELPYCISELPRLEALLLRECERLSHIPSLAKLVSLTKLDLVGCKALEEVPDGLECLVNLQYLDLFRTMIPPLQVVVLRKMVKLQYMSIHRVMDEGVEFKLTTAVELEYLRCRFEDEKQFYTFMSIFQTSKYNLSVGGDIYKGFGESSERLIKIYGDNLGEIRLPVNVEKLVVDSSNTCLSILLYCFPIEDKNLCTKMVMGEEIDIIGPYLGSPQNQSYLDLRELELFQCLGLRYLFSASATCYLKNLRTLTVENCVTLEGITVAGLQLPDGAFSSLESICVEHCNKMRTLVGHSLLPHLEKLRKIDVFRCNNMKEIIESNHLVASRRHSSQSSSSSNHAPPLLHLESLDLSGLPELEVIYDGTMECESIRVFSCPKVKRIPLALPRGADGRLSAPSYLLYIMVHSKEWWESLEWPPNEAKTFLKPIFRPF